MAKKGIILGIAALGAAALAVFLGTRKSSAGGGGGSNAGELQIIPVDAQGNVVEANVSVDGSFVGTGGSSVSVTVGQHTYSVAAAGYNTVSAQIDVPAAGITVTVHLVSSGGGTPPSTGSLDIVVQDASGNPLQANVYVDGQFVGVGSVTGQETIGQHTITASLSGYNDATQYANVTAAGTTITVTMTTVSTPPPASNAFAVTAETATSSPSPFAPAFDAVAYTATVTNNTSQSATHTLTVYYRFVDSSGNMTSLFRLNYGQTITLAPGQSVSFTMPPQVPGSTGPMDYIDIGVDTNACLYLVDENNNASTGACTSGLTPPPAGQIPPANPVFAFKRYDMVVDGSYNQFVITNEGTGTTGADFYTLRPWAYLSTGDPSGDITLPKNTVESTYSIWMHWGFNLVLTQTYHMIGIIPNPMSPGIDLLKLGQLQVQLPLDWTPQQINDYFAPLYYRGTILDLLYFQITQNNVVV